MDVEIKTVNIGDDLAPIIKHELLINNDTEGFVTVASLTQKIYYQQELLDALKEAKAKLEELNV